MPVSDISAKLSGAITTLRWIAMVWSIISIVLVLRLFKKEGFVPLKVEPAIHAATTQPKHLMSDGE
jgi:hypothetical protein